MKDPKKDIIETGDIILVNKRALIAVSDILLRSVNQYSQDVICDLYCDMDKRLCSKINCRHIYYKKIEGGV